MNKNNAKIDNQWEKKAHFHVLWTWEFDLSKLFYMVFNHLKEQLKFKNEL